MDFIFMLTRHDRTIVDCLDVLEMVRPLKLRHIGFKDVGVDQTTLRKLTDAIRDQSAVSYMEVVSPTAEATLASTRIAVELGVDRLLGGTDVAGVQRILKGSAIEYYPFPGLPTGHPTKLGGTAEDIERHCRLFIENGCAGADLLAYRATEADPLALVRSARHGLGDAYLIVAGSVATAAQIAAIRRAGADAFTIGSAIFDGSYASDCGSILSQLAAVQADTAAAA